MSASTGSSSMAATLLSAGPMAHVHRQVEGCSDPRHALHAAPRACVQAPCAAGSADSRTMAPVRGPRKAPAANNAQKGA